MSRTIQCRIRDERDDDLEEVISKIPDNIKSDVFREALRLYFFNKKPKLLEKLNIHTKENDREADVIQPKLQEKKPTPPPLTFEDIKLKEAKGDVKGKLSKLLDY